jgi:xylulokinase
VQRVLLIGGGACSEAVQRIAPAVLGRPVAVPPPAEYVADGACRQAAWALSGAAQPPGWHVEIAATHEAAPAPHVRERYAEVRELTATRRPAVAGGG